MDTKRHWQEVYQTRKATEVSWFQPEARLSLELIGGVAPDPAAAIIDVGGGASTLVDGLTQRGYSAVTVLDLSGTALEQARARLGAAADRVRWIEADILETTLEPASVDLWHDRAVFHFLTDARDRRRYVEQVRRALRPGGHVLVATFAHDGPTRCSGLEICRYTPEGLNREFGDGFERITSRREEHVTPSGTMQAFIYCLCRYEPLAKSISAA